MTCQSIWFRPWPSIWRWKRDPYLERVYLTGQVSNFRRRPNHQYFSLKDEEGRHSGHDLVWRLPEVGLWAGRRHENQCHCGYSSMSRGSLFYHHWKGRTDGIGALAIQFEQLKKNWEKKVFFKKIQTTFQFLRKSVVTSPSGAVTGTLSRRSAVAFPGVEIVLYPTKVQGDGAAAQIADHQTGQWRSDLDVLIIGRGGGSIEDLWAFNEEETVRAILSLGFLLSLVSAMRQIRLWWTL